ncbi:MAG: DNA repair protein RadC [Deltaproteobacteria bacterium]|nr:DNA repair protein RadC [Deltaproteobacteria bacterium]
MPPAPTTARVLPFRQKGPTSGNTTDDSAPDFVEWLETLIEQRKAARKPGQKAAGPSRRPAQPPPTPKRPSIREWPEDDRPRERLLRSGPQALSDSELLAILIRTGDAARGLNAVEQARELLQKAGSLAHLARRSPAELKTLAGLGPAKAAQLLAALALGPRIDRSHLEDRPQVSGSETAFRILREHYADPALEEVVTLLLDTRNRLIRTVRAARGGTSSVTIEPAALFREAIREGAAAIVLSHNHPSGDPTPSAADRRFTSDALAAGKMLSVRVLDHIIVAGPRYFSFLDEGIMGG